MEWMNGMNEWMNGMNKWMNGMNEWMNEGIMNEWMSEWMNEFCCYVIFCFLAASTANCNCNKNMTSFKQPCYKSDLLIQNLDPLS